MDEDSILLLKTIGRNIRKYRIIRDFKQQWLAERCKISAVTLSKIENGNTDIAISTLLKISKILKIEIESLFHDPGEMIH